MNVGLSALVFSEIAANADNLLWLLIFLYALWYFALFNLD